MCYLFNFNLFRDLFQQYSDLSGIEGNDSVFVEAKKLADTFKEMGTDFSHMNCKSIFYLSNKLLFFSLISNGNIFKI